VDDIEWTLVQASRAVLKRADALDRMVETIRAADPGLAEAIVDVRGTLRTTGHHLQGLAARWRRSIP
jgi:hypothetical protein